MNKSKFILRTLGWIGLMIGGQTLLTLFFLGKLLLEMMTSKNFDVSYYEQAISEFMPYILLFGAIPVFIVVLINVFKIENDKPYLEKLKNYIYLHKIRTYDYVGYFSIGISLNIVISGILNMFIKETEESIMVLFSDNIWLSIIIIALIVPIAEEIIFRNKVYWNMYNYNPLKANLVQSILFGLIHGNILQFIYTAILGYIFCLINNEEKSLLPSICMHCGLNFFACITIYFSPIYLYPLIVLAVPTILKLANKKEA